MNRLFQVDIKDVVKNINKENISLYSTIDSFVVDAKQFVSFLENSPFIATEDMAVAYLLASGGGENRSDKNYMADVKELLNLNNPILKDYYYKNKMQLTKMFIGILFDNLPRFFIRSSINKYNTFNAVNSASISIMLDVINGTKPLSSLAALDIINTVDIYKNFVESTYNKNFDLSCSNDTYKRDALELKLKLQNLCDYIDSNTDTKKYTMLLTILNIIVKAQEHGMHTCESSSCIRYINLLGGGRKTTLSTNEIIATTDPLELFSKLDHKLVSKTCVTEYLSLCFVVNMIFVSFLKDNIIKKQNSCDEVEAETPCSSC